MEKSSEIKELASALSKAQSDIEGAIKSTVNPFFKKNYADLQSVWDAIRKPLTDNGLSVTQLAEGTHEEVEVVTMLMHSSGEWISSVTKMKPVKADPQSVGSCLTYARRYALSAIAGVAPEDDDGNFASKKGEKNVVEKETYKPDEPIKKQVTTDFKFLKQVRMKKDELIELAGEGEGISHYYVELAKFGVEHANELVNRKDQVLFYHAISDFVDGYKGGQDA